MMNPRIKEVKPSSKDFTLTLTFENGEVGIFDVKPYLDIGIFKELFFFNCLEIRFDISTKDGWYPSVKL